LLLDLLNKQNMETRRTNQFLKVALGARSPARPKYFKGKFYENAKETRLTFPVNMQPSGLSNSGKKTAVAGDRKWALTAEGGPRAHTTKEGK